MELRVTGKNLEVTPPVRGYVEKKLARVGRRFSAISAFEVVLREEKTKSQDSRFTVECTANARGILMRAEERAGDLYAAIDRAADVMARQIERYKGRLIQRKRGIPSRKGEPATEIAEPPTAEEAPSRVVRVKRHAIKPMSVDEAIDQMELLGHDFFLFLNQAMDEVNVVYRRHNGDFGVIEPGLK
ncbi:MAG: ribosome-associated translation inhibitor RaiA [Chloroflexota bacterium]